MPGIGSSSLSLSDLGEPDERPGKAAGFNEESVRARRINISDGARATLKRLSAAHGTTKAAKLIGITGPSLEKLVGLGYATAQLVAKVEAKLREADGA